MRLTLAADSVQAQPDNTPFLPAMLPDPGITRDRGFRTSPSKSKVARFSSTSAVQLHNCEENAFNGSGPRLRGTPEKSSAHHSRPCGYRALAPMKFRLAHPSFKPCLDYGPSPYHCPHMVLGSALGSCSQGPHRFSPATGPGSHHCPHMVQTRAVGLMRFRPAPYACCGSVFSRTARGLLLRSGPTAKIGSVPQSCGQGPHRKPNFSSTSGPNTIKGASEASFATSVNPTVVPSVQACGPFTIKSIFGFSLATASVQACGPFIGSAS
jgi:hypothetical protein